MRYKPGDIVRYSQTEYCIGEIFGTTLILNYHGGSRHGQYAGSLAASLAIPVKVKPSKVYKDYKELFV